jgi:hypothetical protein
LRKFFMTASEWVPITMCLMKVCKLCQLRTFCRSRQFPRGIVFDSNEASLHDSMGKTLGNSQRNSPLRRLKSIQNVAPMPLFTPDSSSFDESWSRKANIQDGPDSRSTQNSRSIFSR